MAREFETKNLRGLKYFLGIEVVRSNSGIFLSQRKYVLDLLAEVGLLECKPSEDQLNAVMQILPYLKSSPRKGILFSKHDHLNIEGYTDANWAGNISDKNSTSCYFMFDGGNLVTWMCKKQK